MTQYGLTQIIRKPTHLLDYSSSCIDLIFTSQDNLETNSGVHSYLHSNIFQSPSNIFFKFNLKIHSPSYESFVWKYDEANKDLITKAINAFVLTTKCYHLMKYFWISWAVLFQIRRWSLMTGSLCGLTKKSENFTKHKDQIYKDMLDPKSNHNFQFCCRYIQYFINTRIDQAKRRYYENMSRKLSDKSLNPKKYWSLLKTLLNGKKISCMPPIYHNNKFKSKIKANSYFTRQCTPLVNSSRLSK